LGGSAEEQRFEYGVVLAAAFGAPAKAHNPSGMTSKIGRYLEVPVGVRYSKKADGSTEKRDYASHSLSNLICNRSSQGLNGAKSRSRLPSTGRYGTGDGRSPSVLAQTHRAAE
jgi:hypothetical protein